jgi:hypothetical protein
MDAVLGLAFGAGALYAVFAAAPDGGALTKLRAASTPCWQPGGSPPNSLTEGLSATNSAGVMRQVIDACPSYACAACAIPRADSRDGPDLCTVWWHSSPGPRSSGLSLLRIPRFPRMILMVRIAELQGAGVASAAADLQSCNRQWSILIHSPGHLARRRVPLQDRSKRRRRAHRKIESTAGGKASSFVRGRVTIGRAARRKQFSVADHRPSWRNQRRGSSTKT